MPIVSPPLACEVPSPLDGMSAGATTRGPILFPVFDLFDPGPIACSKSHVLPHPHLKPEMLAPVAQPAATATTYARRVGTPRINGLCLVGAGSLAIVWLVASLVLGQATFILQIFEGGLLRNFWTRWIAHEGSKGARVPGVVSRERRRQQLHDQAKKYPKIPFFEFQFDMAFDTQNPRVLPTSLGNILNAAENYPEHRYGVNSIVFWDNGHAGRHIGTDRHSLANINSRL